MKNQTHPKLSHLTESQIETLIARYYGGENLQILLGDYQINCYPSQLNRLFPPEIMKDQPCPYCDVFMVRERRSRSSARYSQAIIQCQVCGHRIGGRSCRCEHCMAEEKRHAEILLMEKSAKILAFCQQTWPMSPHQPAAEDLDLRIAVGLLALARTCAFVEVDGNNPDNPFHLSLESLETAPIPFSPTIDLGRDLIKEMIGRDLIGISELGMDKAFDYSAGEVRGYFLEKVHWILTIEDPVHLLNEITRLAGDASMWPSSWSNAVHDLWMEIAMAECKQYFRHAAVERGLPEAGEKSTDFMLRTLLQNFSVSQCYRIIWGGAQRAADFLVRKRCSRQHAANYMIGECQRWSDRALAEHWDVKHYKRNFDLPRSSLSHVFFDLFLKIGEEGFNSVPKMVIQGYLKSTASLR